MSKTKRRYTNLGISFDGYTNINERGPSLYRYAYPS